MEHFPLILSSLASFSVLSQPLYSRELFTTLGLYMIKYSDRLVSMLFLLAGMTGSSSQLTKELAGSSSSA